MADDKDIMQDVIIDDFGEIANAIKEAKKPESDDADNADLSNPKS